MWQTQDNNIGLPLPNNTIGMGLITIGIQKPLFILEKAKGPVTYKDSTQLNSTQQLSWVSVSFNMWPGVKTGVWGFLKTVQSGLKSNLDRSTI